MKENGKVFFRVDADSRVGLGHLQRSLSLASALRSSGVESSFITQADEHSRRHIKASRFPIVAPPSIDPWTAQDALDTASIAQGQGCEAIVVDSYDADQRYLAELRNAGIYVIARDDLADYAFPCQMVVNGNANALQLDYSSSSGDSVFFLGPEYIALKEEYRDSPTYQVGQSVKNVMVILGGTDHYGLMPKILTALAKLPGDFMLTAVIGPYFQDVSQVEFAAEQAERPIELVRSPNSVRQLMQNADLAVSAAGQALYELAATGCPAVAVQIEQNQAGQMGAFEQAGVVKVAGDAQSDDIVSKIGEAAASLILDQKARTHMSEAGQRLVDGQGALRVARAIHAAIG